MQQVKPSMARFGIFCFTLWFPVSYHAIFLLLYGSLSPGFCVSPIWCSQQLQPNLRCQGSCSVRVLSYIKYFPGFQWICYLLFSLDLFLILVHWMVSTVILQYSGWFLSLLLFLMKMNQQLNFLDDFKIYHENANKKFGLILNQALMLT